MDILKNSDFEDQKFKNINLKGEYLTNKEFINCTFLDSNFSECIFDKCLFSDCNFINCDMSLIKIFTSRFQEVHFQKSKAIGIDWTNISKFNFSIKFESSTIDYSLFTGISINRFELNDSIAHEVDFTQAELEKAIMRNTDFKGTKFERTNLKNADFSESFNYSINAKDNKLKNTKFSLPHAANVLSNLGIIIDGFE